MVGSFAERSHGLDRFYQTNSSWVRFFNLTRSQDGDLSHGTDIGFDAFNAFFVLRAVLVFVKGILQDEQVPGGCVSVLLLESKVIEHHCDLRIIGFAEQCKFGRRVRIPKVGDMSEQKPDAPIVVFEPGDRFTGLAPFPANDPGVEQKALCWPAS